MGEKETKILQPTTKVFVFFKDFEIIFGIILFAVISYFYITLSIDEIVAGENGSLIISLEKQIEYSDENTNRIWILYNRMLLSIIDSVLVDSLDVKAKLQILSINSGIFTTLSGLLFYYTTLLWGIDPKISAIFTILYSFSGILLESSIYFTNNSVNYFLNAVIMLIVTKLTKNISAKNKLKKKSEEFQKTIDNQFFAIFMIILYLIMTNSFYVVYLFVYFFFFKKEFENENKKFNLYLEKFILLGFQFTFLHFLLKYYFSDGSSNFLFFLIKDLFKFKIWHFDEKFTFFSFPLIQPGESHLERCSQLFLSGNFYYFGTLNCFFIFGIFLFFKFQKIQAKRFFLKFLLSFFLGFGFSGFLMIFLKAENVLLMFFIRKFLVLSPAVFLYFYFISLAVHRIYLDLTPNLPGNSKILFFFLIFLMYFSAQANFDKFSRRDDDYFDNFGRILMNKLPPDSILLINHPLPFNILRFLQLFNSYRPDVQLLNLSPSSSPPFPSDFNSFLLEKSSNFSIFIYPPCLDAFQTTSGVSFSSAFLEVPHGFISAILPFVISLSLTHFTFFSLFPSVIMGSFYIFCLILNVNM